MRALIATVVFLVFLALSATVVKNQKKAGDDDGGIKVFFSADAFDAKGYVDNIWDAKVLPHVRERAVDYVELKKAVQAGDRAAIAGFGYRAVEEHNPYNIAVKARIKILSANVKSRNGRAEADVYPFDGEPDFTMLIGPVYKGTSIRDFLDFVNFDDFKNQVEFAKLATQLNTKVSEVVVAPLGLLEDGGVGRVFDIYGVTTEDGSNTNLRVVPVSLVPAAE